MRMTKAARGHSLGGRLAAWLACAAIVAGLVSSAAPAEAVEETRGTAPVELAAQDGVAPDAGDGGIQVLPPDDDGDDTPQPGEDPDGIRVQGDVPGDGAQDAGRPLGAQDDSDGGAPRPTGDEGVAARAQDGTVIASGTWGEYPWEISSDGTLTVHPDEVADTGSGIPWEGYAGDITSVVFAAEGGKKVVAPADCSYLLVGLWNVTTVDASGLDTSWVTNMDGMFSGCSGLSSLDLSGWGTGQVTDMASMFSGCPKLASLVISGWDTRQVTNMNGMFSGCSGLTSLDLSGWDTGQVTDMASMFSGCSGLTSLDLSGWDTGQVTNMSYMFNYCSSLASLDLSGWDTGQVTNMSNMFYGCSGLRAVYVDLSWSTRSDTWSDDMFSGCASLVGGAGTKYDGSHTDGTYACVDGGANDPGYLTGALALGTWGGCPWLVSLGGVLTVRPGAGADTYGASPWAGHADEITSVVFVAEGDQKVVAPEVCSGLLRDLENVTFVDASGLDTSGVTDMRSMFRGCSKLRAVYIGGSWSKGRVTWSDDMFRGCDSLVGGAGTAYEGSHTDAEYARVDGGEGEPGYLTGTVAVGWWGGCRWLVSLGGVLTVRPGEGANTNGNSPWSVYAEKITSVVFAAEGDQKVIAPADCSDLLYGLDNVTTVDASGLDTSGVTDMHGMFNECFGLASLVLSGWDTGKVTDMSSMFNECYSLVSLDLSGWNTGSVTNMAYMFSGCSKLASLVISGWDTGQVTNMSRMFSGCSKLESLSFPDGWATDNVTDMSSMFSGCSGLSSLGLSGWDTGEATDMGFMFSDCSSLSSLSFPDRWTTSKVTRMSSMFDGCSGLVSLGLSGWDTGKVTSMRSMFSGCSGLASLDLSGWDTGEATDMGFMFSDCSGLGAVYVGDSWSTDNVVDSNFMFYGCTSLRGGDGTVFDSSHVGKEYAHVDGGTEGPGYLTRTLSVNGGAYEIGSAADWDVFCGLLEANPKGRFSGKTVRLAADIGTAEDPVTRMAGGSEHDFTGTFDGCGHTLTVRYGSADSPVESDKAAPFRNVESGCVIEDLRVEGDIYTSAKCAGGIVGTQYGAVSIVGCGVGATIHGLTEGDGTHGGLVGRNGNGTGSSLTIRGCAFYGKVLSEGGATTDCAGFVGWRHQTVTVTDSIYAPAALGAGEQEPGGGGATFVRNGDGATITNCYYTRALGAAQGKAARSVKAGEGVAQLAVVPVGVAMAPAHATSGITAYANGIERGGTYYFGAGDKVALSLGAVERLGYTHAGYTASAGELAGVAAGGYALTMPDEDVTVAAAYEPVDNAPLAQVLGHSLTLKGSVGVNTYLLVGDTISSDAAYVVEFWRGGELARSERVSDADEVRQSVGGRTYLARRLTVTAVAKEMDVKFAMKIKAPDGTYVDFADTKGTPINGATGLDYSVNDYLNDMAQNGGTEELKRLCENMRNYGAYAKHYFGKRDGDGWPEERPKIDDFKPVSEGDLKGFAPTLQQPEIAHFTYVGSTLVLEDETRFRLYFTSDDPTKLVAKYRVSGTQDTPADLVIEKGSGGFSDYHYVEVPNIVAKQLGDMYEFTFTDKDDNQTATVKHGPYAYVRWAVGLAGEDDNTVNLRYVASALYRYGESAKAYFATRQQ